MEAENIAYTVVINGKPEGPYQLEQLKALNIRPGTFIRKPGMDDYKEAHEFAELRELLGFTYQRTAPQYFASFDQRLLASVIDYFFITIAFVLLALLSFLIIEGQNERIMAIVAGLPVIPIVKLIYSSIAEAGKKQATAGKALMNIKVTDLAGNPVTLGNSFGRNFAKALSAAPFFLGYLYSFLNKKQQCFHDIVANTLVIKDRLI
ncbi:RDD family protein [Pedobacter metabolipauper]|uniref:Putative RDD family membrane protein YckC n=1 Tax=Pedobacter metabolipauper TaxID=425513 RepID=A0A4R6SVF4_9SPHI|nr:RDD family protein [Pedobacter metabolipauper]TDQ08740.1 putative RDD family membrane protein YckC [Pedobacter metabolipauper]